MNIATGSEHIYGTCAMTTYMANVTITVPEDLKRAMKEMRRINWSGVARNAFEEAIRKEEMSEAATGMDRLRTSSRTPSWSGAREIRRWRDASKKSS